MRFKTVAALVVAAGLSLVGAGAASASSAPAVTAAPENATVDGTVIITATGLGGLETASFGLSDVSGVATLTDPATGTTSTLVQAAASGGTATVNFSASQAGTYTVSVGDGETSLAQTTVTVSDVQPAVVSVTASPESITVGETSTVTASGLGGLETAFFGLDDTAGGTFASSGGGEPGEVAVTNGEATAEFTAAEAGTFTVAVGDGENVLGTTTITVEAAAPTATPTPVATDTPVTTMSEGIPGWLVWVLIAGGVVLVALIVVIIVLVTRRRSGSSAGAGGTPTV